MNDEDLRLFERAAREDSLVMWDYLRASARAATRPPLDLLEDEWIQFAWFEACAEVGSPPPELLTDEWREVAEAAIGWDESDPCEYVSRLECFSHGAPDIDVFLWPDDIALVIVAREKRVGNREYLFGGRIKDGRYVELFLKKGKRRWQRGAGEARFYPCPRRFMWSFGHFGDTSLIGPNGTHPWVKGLLASDLACGARGLEFGLDSAPEWYRLARHRNDINCV